jgi:hypothetical protein
MNPLNSSDYQSVMILADSKKTIEGNGRSLHIDGDL